MCQIKILINVEQNPYWSIITSMLRSECWVFTEHLEHPENTPMPWIPWKTSQLAILGKEVAFFEQLIDDTNTESCT